VTLKNLLNGATVLAAALTPGLAPGLAHAAAPVGAGIASAKIAPLAVVDMAQLATSAANRTALATARPLPPMPLRYPNGGKRAAVLTPGLAPNTTVVAAPRATVTGINGSYDGQLPAVLNYELEPPDQGLAVNNNEVVEIVNNVLEIYSAKTGKSVVGPISNYAVFGLTENGAPILSDPHVEYDAAVGRWFIEELIGLSNGFYGFALAVSETSNPAGKYYIYQIDDQGANISACEGSCLPDYPQPGYDANAFYIDADLFSNVSGNFIDTGLYAMPLPALIAGQSFTYDYYLLPDFVVEPAIPAAPGQYATESGGTEFFLSAQNILYGTDTLSVWSLSNTGAIGTSSPPTAYNTILNSEAYTSTVPATEPNDVGPYGLSVGATTSPMLDGGYNSLGSGVKFLGGAMYTALTTGTTDSKGLARNQIAWFKVAAQGSTAGVRAHITAQGYVTPPAGYSIEYPGFALTAGGKGLIGFTISAPDAALTGGYPSTAIVSFTNGVPGTKILVTGQGSASDDGFTGYPGPGPAGVGRWGDYSSATNDPATGTLWIGNEYIPNASVYPRGTYANWGTFLTSVAK
jgi:hypothetical protein